MDNAAKALTIAGGVLIGLLILSLGVYLANSMKEFGDNTVFSDKTFQSVQRYNEPFYKVINESEINQPNWGNSNFVSKKTMINAGDVISCMNYARSINLNYGFEFVTMNVVAQTSSGIINGDLDTYFMPNSADYTQELRNLADEYSILKYNEESSTEEYIESTVSDVKLNEYGQIVHMKVELKKAIR